MSSNAPQLMKNTLLLAASSVLLRLCALCFQAYLAAKVGAQELGVFGIIASVGVVFATVSISGVRFSVTRLAAEEMSLGNHYPRALMRCAFLYAAFFGFLAGLVMFFCVDALAVHWVMEASAEKPLRIMALSMPLIALGSCAEGYFTAKQKIFRLVFSEVMAQLARIVFIVFSFNVQKNMHAADVLAKGFFAAESALAISLLFLYAFESVGKKESAGKKKHLSALITTALPLAVSAYMRTGLSSLGQIIIPRGLRKAGMGAAGAFSTYGVIGQMSMPVIMFPAALLTALGEILVPRLTSAQVQKQRIGISYIVNRALRIGIIFSFGVAGVMLFYSGELGEALYKSTEAGLYIKIFAPIVPIIYIDCVTDGCLKGLGQQVYSMVFNVLEGVLNVVMLFFLLPKMAIMGYIVVMYIKEIFNAALSMHRLSKVTAVDINIPMMLSVCGSVWGAWIMNSIAAASFCLTVQLCTYCVFYVALLYIINAVTRDDIKWAISLTNAKKI